MDKRLNSFLKERRTERCPDRVLARVQSRISSVAPGTAGKGLIAWLASGVVVLVLGLSLVNLPVSSPTGQPSQAPDSIALQSIKNRQVLQEAYASLGYLGKALLAAGKQSSRLIVEESLPPLRNGFEDSKNAIRKTQ